MEHCPPGIPPSLPHHHPTTMKTRIALASAAIALATPVAALAQNVTWNFTNDGTGTVPSFVTASDSGSPSTNATITGYTYNPNGTKFETAVVSRWSGAGLGMERSGDGEHQLDNVGSDEFLLFQFNKQLSNLTFSFDPTGSYDRDVYYWVGNVAAGTNLNNKTTAELAALGFQAGVLSARGVSSSTFDVTLSNVPAGGINTVLLGGPIGEDDDRYKITGLAAKVVPEPAALGLLGVAGLLGARRRRR